MGAGAGAAQPVYGQGDYWGTKAAQTGTGAITGAAVPAAWEGTKLLGRGVRNVVQPYLGQGGADKAAGRLANMAVGDKRQQVIQALKNPEQYVPDSNPTAAQAAAPANSAEFSALEMLAAKRKPSDYYGPQGIEGQQNAARVAAVRSVGKTPADLAAAEGKRAADAAANYGAVSKDVVRLINADPNVFNRPAMRKALEVAEGLTREQGRKWGNTVQDFQNVKMALDDMVKNPERFGLGGSEANAIGKTKEAFVKWLSKESPGWDKARADYASSSRPINQMQIGQELEKKLVPALSDEAKQRAAVYANALREAPQTIKRATGQPRYDDLSQIMEPGQMATLGNVQKDLARDALVKQLASKGEDAARENIGRAIPEAPPTGMFSPILSVTRGAYNRLTGRATEKVLDDLALKMKNPQEIARIMESATPMERRALVDMLMRYQGATFPSVEAQGVR